MIFHDAAAVNDTSDDPAERDDNCLNCHDEWMGHYGWSCVTRAYLCSFGKLLPTEHFISQSMLDSLSDAADRRRYRHLLPDLPEQAPAPAPEPVQESVFCFNCGEPLTYVFVPCLCFVCSQDPLRRTQFERAIGKDVLELRRELGLR